MIINLHCQSESITITNEICDIEIKDTGHFYSSMYFMHTQEKAFMSFSVEYSNILNVTYAKDSTLRILKDFC